MITYVQIGDNQTIYFDGALAVAGESGTPYNTLIGGIFIGSDGAGNNFTGSIDEVSFWNRTLKADEIASLYDGGTGTFRTGAISLNFPSDNYASVNTTIVFNATANQIGSNVRNMTLYIWYANSSLYNTTITNVSGISNTTTWSMTVPLGDSYVWGVNGCYDTSCYWSLNNTFNITTYLLNSQTYNSSTYETAQEYFVLNYSLISFANSTFTYDGTSYSVTPTIDSGGNYIFSKSLDIALTSTVANRSFYWNINGVNTTMKNQTINPIYFVLCNSTFATKFLNFTFLDEITLAATNGSFNPLITNYYLGSGSIYKTLNFVNTSQNLEYDFCLNVNKTLNVIMNASYSNTGYPARYWTNSYNLTNVTTKVQLYLLGSASGVSIFIQVVDSNGDKVSGAIISASRQIGGASTIVEQEITGTDGGATFWLSPLYEHTLVASKSGCSVATVSFTPTQPQYTLTMNCAGSLLNDNYLQSTIEGITYTRGPNVGLMQINENGSVINFTYTVLSQKNNIVKAKFVIANQTSNTDGSRYIVNSTFSSCAPAGCSLSLTYNASTNETLYGLYYVDVGNGYVLLEADAQWVLIPSQPSSYTTLKNIFSDFAGLFESWSVVNGEWSKDTADDINKQEYSRLVFFFLVAALCLALFSKFTGYDYANPGWMLLILNVVMWGLSISNGIAGNGYFYMSNIVPEIYNGAHWFNNYILPLTLTLLSGGIVMNAIANKRD